MSFLGKILVGLQFALSILFLVFAGAVFTAQTNWKNAEKVAKDRTEQIEGEKRNVEAEFLAYKNRMDRDLKAERDKSATAEGQARLFKDQLDTLEKELIAAKTERDVQRRLADVSKEEAQQRRDEAIRQRGVNNDLHKLLNEKNDRLTAKEDELFNKLVDEKALKEKHETILKDMAIFQKIIAANGLSTDPKTVAGLQVPPPVVDGLVLETKRGGRSGSDLVEISLGRDDGLVEGHKLQIFRAAKYLGEIKLVYVTPDRAVGSVVSRAKNGIIEKGDNVTSKL